MFRNVIVGISGGVDSAVAALLLKNKGFNVTGVFMQNWDIADETGHCAAEKDYEDATWVCDKLKIPLVRKNFVKEYWNSVFDNLITTYKAGSTPNPDIECNRVIKFNKFFHFARDELKADAIATGHYVKSSFGPYLENFNANKKAKLQMAKDFNKDQTLFLSQISQEALRYSMFPLGDFLKPDIKKIAADAGLSVVLQKRESAGICFIGRREFKNFISEYVEDKPGKFIDLDTGKCVGEHNGIHQYTVGQRSKFGCTQGAYYVFQKDFHTNDIIVVLGEYHPALFSRWIFTEKPHWISETPKPLDKNVGVYNCAFRFQHRNRLIDCSIQRVRDDRLIVRLVTPKRALTSGQYAVFYDGEECLGGARIIQPGPSLYSLNEELIFHQNLNH